MSAWGDFSTSDTLLGVGRSDACAVGRSGESSEAPCWRTISLVASPFANIETIAAWSNASRNGITWRWAYSGDASRNARVSPRVLPGISTYSSYVNSQLTRGGIGAGESDVGEALAVVSLPVGELAEWRRVQEMARRQAQTAVWERRYPFAVLLAQPRPG